MDELGTLNIFTKSGTNQGESLLSRAAATPPLSFTNCWSECGAVAVQAKRYFLPIHPTDMCSENLGWCPW